MKRFPAVALLFMMALITLIIAGCVAFQKDLSTFNTLPDNAPKGYVEFYSDESEDAIKLFNDLAGSYFIYQYEDGVATEIKGLVWDWRTRRRIAVRPGRHTFIVTLKSAEQKVTVDVDEGMLLPVRVIIDLWGGTVAKYEFDKIGLNSSDIFQKLIENGWATLFYSKTIRLTTDLDEEKDRMANTFGEDFSKILPILQRAPYGSSIYNFYMTLSGEDATPFVKQENK